MYEIYYLAILLPEIIIGGILTVYVYLYSEKDTRILIFCILIVITGVLISYVVISFFASHFSIRVNKLRSSMHSVSNEEYEMSDTLRGNDEIAAAYEELKKTAQLIKEKDSEVFQTKLDAERFATEQQMMEYLQLTITPIVEQWEEELNRKLLTPEDYAAGYRFRFDTASLTRTDVKTTAERNQMAIRGGWRKPNEVRAELSLPPDPYGDQLMSSRDLIPLSVSVEHPELLLGGKAAPGDSEGKEEKAE
jgi:hypothetical protein